MDAFMSPMVRFWASIIRSSFVILSELDAIYNTLGIKHERFAHGMVRRSDERGA
jgi:hypothetical protein